jgi:hypothetical protein
METACPPQKRAQKKAAHRRHDRRHRLDLWRAHLETLRSIGGWETHLVVSDAAR